MVDIVTERQSNTHRPTPVNFLFSEEAKVCVGRGECFRADIVGGDAIAFGHTHLPWRRDVDDVTFINTGSVGRPKDGDSRAGYVVVDFTEARIDVAFRRVEYDVGRAAEAIVASALPDEFAHYLLSGGKTFDPT